MDDYCGVRTEALQNSEGSTIFRLLLVFLCKGI